MKDKKRDRKHEKALELYAKSNYNYFGANRKGCN